MKAIKFQVTGTSPLMLNNPQTVSPFNKYTKLLKPLTSKRTKTEEDLMEISRIKFLASLYVEKDGTYFIPMEHFEQSLNEAAKERKLGKKFERSLYVLHNCPLEFKDKDKTPEELFEIGEYVDVRAVGIKNVKITTTRAFIENWSTTVELMYDESQLDENEINEVFEIAGMRYGIGTYRRKYGRFTVKKLKWNGKV